MLSRRRFLERSTVMTGGSVFNQPLLFKSTMSGTPSFRPTEVSGSTAADPATLERAMHLLEKAPLIDTHNDLPSMLLKEAAGDLTRFDMGKEQPSLCGDVPRLRAGRIGAQYWAIFVESATQRTHTSLHEALREFDVALRLIRSQSAFEQARTADDIERIHGAGKIACLLGVEGGHTIENSAAALRIFYELGARYMTLTHWDNIDWADAATDRPESNGLTELGKQVIREMNRIGMFVDISHVSADTMRDVLQISRAPVIFSHSNAFAVDAHPRNAPDDVLRWLAKNGGVIHVNFIKAFVSPKDGAWQNARTAEIRNLHLTADTDDAVASGIKEWEKKNPYPRPTIADLANHIDHIREIAGIDHIGIGADFYNAGQESMVAGLDDVTRYPYLFAELLARKYSDEDVLKIAGRNHLRVMRQMERVAADLQKTEHPLITEGIKRT